MKPWYTVSHSIYFGNAKTIECVNYPKSNEVKFFYWLNNPMCGMEYTVAIFKIKPKSK